MTNINNLFFELLRVAIGTQSSLSRVPSAQEWKALYDMAKKQSLVGICFAGLQRLGADADSGFSKLGLTEMQYLTWMGMAAKIQQRNNIVEDQCVILQKRLAAEGLRNFLMKGQCNAALYGDLCNLRQSGDIDVYVDGGREKVLEFVNRTAPTSVINEIECEYKCFDGTEVDMHFAYSNIRHPFRNRKFHKYLDSYKELNYTNYRRMRNGESVSCPAWEYDLVFQLVHVYEHFISRGVGFRQVMDYYFLLKNLPKNVDVAAIEKGVSDMGLTRFASGLMWVLQHVFGLRMVDVLWVPNERDGRFLLQEILLSGNFGQGNDRMKDVVTNTWKRAWVVNANAFRYWRFDHWAWFWSPLWRIYHFIWKRLHGFKK